jgi:hypothetical protein
MAWQSQNQERVVKNYSSILHHFSIFDKLNFQLTDLSESKNLLTSLSATKKPLKRGFLVLVS